MGWLNLDHAGHEGYLIGFIREDERWLELRYSNPATRDRIVERVQAFQVGCDCGWRSTMFRAPLGTRYYPCSTSMRSESHEDAARTIWEQHLVIDWKGPFVPEEFP